MIDFSDPEVMRRVNVRLRWHLRNEQIALKEIYKQWNGRLFENMTTVERQEAWDNAKRVLIENGFVEASKKILR